MRAMCEPEHAFSLYSRHFASIEMLIVRELLKPETSHQRTALKPIS